MSDFYCLSRRIHLFDRIIHASEWNDGNHARLMLFIMDL